MKEVFKVIHFAPNYAVSNLGRVKRITPKKRDFGKKDVFLYGRLDRGWRYVCLQLPNKKEKAFRVHRLVMSEFTWVSKLGINHINGIKDDNRLENLEYATPKENSEHAARIGLSPRGTAHYAAKLTEQQVIKMRKCGRYFSHSSLAKIFNVSKCCVGRVLRGIGYSNISSHS
jgi:hypothetical protein